MSLLCFRCVLSDAMEKKSKVSYYLGNRDGEGEDAL